LWNVFPLHPHEAGEPFSNRSHNARERAAGEDVLAELIELLAPKRIIAIGNDAARSAGRVSPNKEAIQVRHPSYGGQTEFLAQMKTLYHYRTRTFI
jgi:uracil-DNA glycosylase